MNLLWWRVMLVAALWCGGRSAQAQWQTQAIELQPGWNAVYLHVDPGHADLDTLLGANQPNLNITEIWAWLPQVATAQFHDDPAQPMAGTSEWRHWNRTDAAGDLTLSRLMGNLACLVRNTNSTAITWQLTGRPVAPRYDWSQSGANFIGFATPGAAAPTWQDFLTPAPALLNGVEIWEYPGANNTNNSPRTARLYNLAGTVVTRGRAYWVRNPSHYNRYFGPVQVLPSQGTAIAYGDQGGRQSIRLRNVSNTKQTVTLSLHPSATPPAGQATLAGGTIPLLLRGGLNVTNLSYDFTALSAGGGGTFTLAPAGQEGAETNLVIGLDRGAMSGAAGTRHGGILRFQDAGGRMRVEVGVSAEVPDTAGLWVGAASVTHVKTALRKFRKESGGKLQQVAHGRVAFVTGNAHPLLSVGQVSGRAIRATGDPARYVRIELPGTNRTKILTLAEVEVYSGGMNIAPGKAATQISTHTNGNGAAANAIDGNRHPVWATNHSHTAAAGESNAWWELDLGATNSIDKVRVWNRGETNNAYSNRLDGFTLKLLDAARNPVFEQADIRQWGMIEIGVANQGRLSFYDYHPTDATDTATLPTLVAPGTVAGSRVELVYSDGGTERQVAAEVVGVAGTGEEPRFDVVALPGAGNLPPADQITAVRYETNGMTKSQAFTRAYGHGAYLDQAVSNGLSKVARPFALRFIVHDSTNASSRPHLLQRVYVGWQGTNQVLATRQALLDASKLADSRRVSSYHLPFSHTNAPWPALSGSLAAGGQLVFEVPVAYDDHAANPFLHTFHPDHDNLGTDFKTVQASGRESYGITRRITLDVQAPGTGFDARTSATTSLGGAYRETLTLTAGPGQSRQFEMQGAFLLYRAATIPALTTE